MTRHHIIMPQIRTRSDGGERRVGVEIEMSGIDLPVIAEVVANRLGGKVRKCSPYEYEIENTVHGTFKVELDFETLTKYGRERLAPEMDKAGDLELLASDALGALAKNVVPCELVSPPIPMGQLTDVDDIILDLRESGAKGTRESVIFAFGVHLNPELPSLNSVTVLRYFKAFLCLVDWLTEHERVDLARKLSPFIRSFPGDYMEKVLSNHYQPDMETFMDDYLLDNPTRNRVMDMLPLFAWLDEDKVRDAVGNQKLRKRPTLHYRLPNSDVDHPGWGIWRCWNDWCQVEALANDPLRLRQVCDGYLYNHKLLSKELMTPWKEKVKTWLIDLS